MTFIRGEGLVSPRRKAMIVRASSALGLVFTVGACSFILDFSEPDNDGGPGDGADLCTVYEPNDSRQAPYDLGPTDQGPAAICPGAEHDFYGFTLGAGQDLDLLIGFANRAGAGDLELRLYDSLGVKVAESLSFDDNEQITRTAELGNALPAGEYTFEIFGQSASVQNDYTIMLTLSGGTPVDGGADDAAVDAGI
jgi:hypothetical protein